jgi:hypothetical protein
VDDRLERDQVAGVILPFCCAAGAVRLRKKVCTVRMDNGVRNFLIAAVIAMRRK